MNSTVGLILYMGFFFGLMYFLIIRPQKKKTKQLNDLRGSVKAGDQVVTIGGLVGNVINVKEDDFTIEVGAARTKLTFKKWAISTIEKSSSAAVEVETIEIEE
ncbi:preprotein translocase subunit YajC [Fusibacter bizertensis]|jgi:preprotein translocase, YajC subunit|uniref:Preprotein translocase subunit YajC n=1 Tax=Fusibacter bizertensis TaxID=1488331 RepID=A0ABT6N9Q9_9FIRM|nr:preprotein translocase subunit YajC [Fusibacter bizertensis]MDH8677142.1 preprotein translocase subunit YajC [Fusibacter bizertensis]